MDNVVNTIIWKRTKSLELFSTQPDRYHSYIHVPPFDSQIVTCDIICWHNDGLTCVLFVFGLQIANTY